MKLLILSHFPELTKFLISIIIIETIIIGMMNDFSSHHEFTMTHPDTFYYIQYK